MPDPTSTPDAPAPDLRNATATQISAAYDAYERACGNRWERITQAVDAALRAERDEAQPVAWDSDFRAEIERIADDYHPCGGERDIAIALDEMREALQAALEAHPFALSPAATVAEGLVSALGKAHTIEFHNRDGWRELTFHFERDEDLQAAHDAWTDSSSPAPSGPADARVRELVKAAFMEGLGRGQTQGESMAEGFAVRSPEKTWEDSKAYASLRSGGAAR